MEQIDIYNIAKKEEGISEFIKDDCPRIIEYHSCTTLHAKSSSIPWCSSLINWCCFQCGINGTRSAAAISWLDWGEKVDVPELGDIVILKRGAAVGSSQAHVGFFEQIDSNRAGSLEIKVFGGNQGDKVKSSWFPASRVIGYRRLKSSKEP